MAAACLEPEACTRSRASTDQAGILEGLDGLEGPGWPGGPGGLWRGPTGTGPCCGVVGRSFGLGAGGVNCAKFTPPPPAPGRA